MDLMQSWGWRCNEHIGQGKTCGYKSVSPCFGRGWLAYIMAVWVVSFGVFVSSLMKKGSFMRKRRYGLDDDFEDKVISG